MIKKYINVLSIDHFSADENKYLHTGAVYNIEIIEAKSTPYRLKDAIFLSDDTNTVIDLQVARCVFNQCFKELPNEQ